MKHNQRNAILTVALVFALTLLACDLTAQAPVTQAPQAPTPEDQQGETPVVEQPTDSPRPTVTHLVSPGEPPGAWLSEITDRDTSPVAAEKRALGGENININLFERPFNTAAMDVYFPDLDITRARLFEDSAWVYVTIRLAGRGEDEALAGYYGLEVDLDVDGRGEFLIFASAPGTAWSTDGVRAWADVNNDVGGSLPIYAEAPYGGDGYETLTFDSGLGDDPDLAWARQAPDDDKSVQIAFKIDLLQADNKFTWGAWTDGGGVLNPAWFDYDDHFTPEEAGSPLIESAEYPILALYELDNTCRWAVGFTPTGSEPGICPVPVTPTSIPPGTISGVVFNDWTNGDLVLDPASGRIPGATVRARQGECSAPGSTVATAITNSDGVYLLTVPAGTYCVDVYPDAISTVYKTPPQTVTVGSGGAVNNINFGFSQKLALR